jgi:hypothetical protein
MRSAARGKRTSGAEVTTITPKGFSLLVGRREYFVAFRDFPWFRNASIAQLYAVELPSPHHLHWPELDIDLAVESLDNPERYPLVSKAQPNKRLKLTSATK